MSFVIEKKEVAEKRPKRKVTSKGKQTSEYRS